MHNHQHLAYYRVRVLGATVKDAQAGLSTPEITGRISTPVRDTPAAQIAGRGYHVIFEVDARTGLPMAIRVEPAEVKR